MTQSQTKDLRNFGFIVGGIFAFISLSPVILHGGSVRIWASIVSFLLLLPASVFPSVLLKPYQVWMRLGHLLGWFNTRIILSVLFFILVTPIGVARRLFGFSSFSRKRNQGTQTYLIKAGPELRSDMTQQF